MSKIFITPVEPENWERKTAALQVNVDWFSQKLSEKWTDALLKPSADKTHILLWWRLPPEEDNNALTGELQANKQIVALEDGPKRSFIEFIFWYRNIIDAKYNLYLVNESQPEYLELTPSINGEALIKFMNFA